MNFYFESFADFAWMDGHGPYVWSCYAATIAVFVILAYVPSLRKKAFVKQQQSLLARQAARATNPLHKGNAL